MLPRLHTAMQLTTQHVYNADRRPPEYVNDAYTTKGRFCNGGTSGWFGNQFGLKLSGIFSVFA